MKKFSLAVTALVIAGLASPIVTAGAKTHKHHKSQTSATSGSTTNSGMTTGSTAKSNAANPSSQGNVGPGTNQAGSKPQ